MKEGDKGQGPAGDSTSVELFQDSLNKEEGSVRGLLVLLCRMKLLPLEPEELMDDEGELDIDITEEEEKELLELIKPGVKAIIAFWDEKEYAGLTGEWDPKDKKAAFEKLRAKMMDTGFDIDTRTQIVLKLISASTKSIRRNKDRSDSLVHLQKQGGNPFFPYPYGYRGGEQNGR